MEKKLRVCLVLTASMLILACNLQPASTIRIKTSPEFEASLGTKTVDVADELGKLLKGGENSIAKVYRFQSEDKEDLRYLLHYPLKEIDIDIKQHLNKNIAPSFDKKLQSYTFPIPNVTSDKTQEIDLSAFNQKIRDQFTITVPPIQLQDEFVTSANTALLLQSPLEKELPAIKVAFSGCKTLTFGSGSTLKLTINGSKITYTVAAAKLQSGGETIPGVVDGSENVSFNIAGKTLENPSTLICTLSIRTIEEGANFTLNASLGEQSVLEKATGIADMKIDLDTTSGLKPQTITIPENEYFIAGKVKQGSIAISATLPSGWQGISLQKYFKIKQEAGIVLPGTTGTPVYSNLSGPISLNGQAISKNPITVTPALRVAIKNGVYVRKDNLTMGVKFAVNEFESVTFKQPANIAQTITEDAGAIKDMVQKITFAAGKPAISIMLKHNLPAGTGGTPLKLHLQSDSFKIDDTKEFPANSEQPKTFKSTANPLTIDFTTHESFDITSTIILPNANAAEKTFTLRDIKSGDTFSFSGSVTVDADWDSVQLQDLANKEFDVDLGANLQQLSSIMEKMGVKILEAPMYLYFTSAALKDVQPKMRLAASITGGHNPAADKAVFAGTSGEPLAITLLHDALRLNQNQDHIVTKIPEPSLTISEDKKGNGVQATFADLLNDYPTGIKLKCFVSMKGVELKKSTIEKLKGDTKVRIDALIEMPLGLKVEDSTSTNKPVQEVFADYISDDAKKRFEEDLFGRTAGTSQDFLEFIKTASIVLTLDNPLKHDAALVFALKDKSTNGILVEKNISVKSGHSTVLLSFTQEDIQKIAKTVPCIPELRLDLKRGEYRISKDAKFSVALAVKSKLDVDYKIK